jgi:pimeloyl-ACP methyl ester carboxylesterase
MGSRWRQADDIDRLRDSLGLNRCAIVAHSAGTRLAIAYAAQFPSAWQQAIAPLCYVQWDQTAQAHARTGWYALAAARAFLSDDPPACSPTVVPP